MDLAYSWQRGETTPFLVSTPLYRGVHVCVCACMCRYLSSFVILGFVMLRVAHLIGWECKLEISLPLLMSLVK